MWYPSGTCTFVLSPWGFYSDFLLDIPIRRVYLLHFWSVFSHSLYLRFLRRYSLRKPYWRYWGPCWSHYNPYKTYPLFILGGPAWRSNYDIVVGLPFCPHSPHSALVWCALCTCNILIITYEKKLVLNPYCSLIIIIFYLKNVISCSWLSTYTLAWITYLERWAVVPQHPLGCLWH